MSSVERASDDRLLIRVGAYIFQAVVGLYLAAWSESRAAAAVIVFMLLTFGVDDLANILQMIASKAVQWRSLINAKRCEGFPRAVGGNRVVLPPGPAAS